MTRPITNNPSRRAMTLVETLASIVVLSIIGATTLPLLFVAGDSLADATQTRRSAEHAAFAMDRTIRLLRESPEGATRGTLAISSATLTGVRFTDGRGIELTGTTLYLYDTSGTRAALCEDVRSFTLGYLAKDGTTSTQATPASTHRFDIRLDVGGMRLNAAAFARVRIGQP